MEEILRSLSIFKINDQTYNQLLFCGIAFVFSIAMRRTGSPQYFQQRNKYWLFVFIFNLGFQSVLVRAENKIPNQALRLCAN
jgi:hypothetical protein